MKMKLYKMVITIFGLKSLTLHQFLYSKSDLGGLDIELPMFWMPVQTRYQSVNKLNNIAFYSILYSVFYIY